MSNKEYSRSSCKWHSTCKWWQNSSISIKNWKKIELVISNDGRIRGAIVLTKTNEAEHLIRRPINRLYRSNSSEVFLGKGVLKICSKFKGVHPYRSVISTKLQNNFIEIALRHGYYPVNLLHIFGTPFPKNNFGGLYSSLEFWQFTIVRDLLKLLFDFITISILRFFVITESLLYLIFFCLLGGK